MLTSQVQDHVALRDAIEALNLDPIKVKLMDKEEGKGWSRAFVDHVEKLYKRFLFMVVTQSTSIVPTKDVDAFWHQHILDTRKYAQDCDATFGFFLHHFPYFGMRGEQDAQNLANAFAQTQAIYARLYGEPLIQLNSHPAGCGEVSDQSQGCGSSCTDCGSCGVRDNDILRADLRPQLAEPIEFDIDQGCSTCGVRDDDVMRADLRPQLVARPASPHAKHSADCGAVAIC